MSSNARGSLRVVALGVGLAAVLAMPASAQQGSQDAVTKGARVYGDMCGRCHNARSPLERTDRDWVTIVNHMRIRGNLTGPQTRLVLAFLQATNSDAGPANPSANAVEATNGGQPLATGPLSTDAQVIAKGQQLVQSHACIGCHVIGSAGGRVGPALNGVVQRRGPDFVRQKLANPGFYTPTTMMPNFGFTRDEIEAIAAYLQILPGQ